MTSPVVEALHMAQIKAGDGPMLTALTREPASTSLTSPKLAALAELSRRGEDPQRAARADEIGDHVIGVLSLYTLHPDSFTADDEAIAQRA